MTGRERFLKVLGGEMPDRVPVTLFIQDQGHFLTQVYPDQDPLEYEQLQLKVVEIQRQLGVDVFVRMLFGLNDPLAIHCGGLNVSTQTENWEVATTEIRSGNTLVQRSVIKTPDGTLEQDFSINELRPSTFMYGCTRKPIRCPGDLEMAVRYEPPFLTEEKAQRIAAQVRRVKEAVGDDGIVGSWSPHGPFNNASLLVDEETIYSLFLTDFDFYERLMTFAADRVLEYVRAMDAAGVDVHCIGGNVAGGFVGRRSYDTYILPFERRYIDVVQENGTPAVYHNCGKIMNLVESYKQLGTRVVEPFSPPPLGDADLARAKQWVDGAYVMIGGVDQVNVLQKGTTDEVCRKTEETINTGKPGGKFILQSADFLEYGTPIENLEAYVRTALEHAAY
ncbi:MAG TPA: hypothetical protein DD670_05900 [Planctomycetaceae bacterium]|nr:hypothetical protein [Planctomycetaceae bacterium]